MADDTDEVVQSVRETENDLLQDAFAPPAKEPPAPEPAQAPEPPAEAEAAEAEQPKAKTPRDLETGRFVKADGQQAPAEAAPEEPPAEADRVPSWRLREINEERRALAEEAQRLRVENARLMGMRAQETRQQTPVPPKPLPDPILDPEGFYKRVREDTQTELEQRYAHDRLNLNLEVASVRYGEAFEKAFEAVIQVCQNGNPHFARQFTSQANPGQAIMSWYNRVTRDQRIGPDLDAYDKRREEELLSNPEFLAKAAERHREIALNGGAPPRGQQQKPNTVVRMPPSLSKATGSAEAPQTATDGSEDALFAYAMQPKRRG
jgi:hypothetical protein